MALQAIRSLVTRSALPLASAALVVGMATGGTGGWVLSSATSSEGEGRAEPSADDDVAERWAGTTHSTYSSGSAFATTGYSADGDFWFTVDEGGEVVGHAVVVYEPRFEAAGLNAALAYIRTIGATALGIAIPPPWGAVISGLGNAVTNGLSVRGVWDQTTTTVEGPIHGTLDGDRITIAWDRGTGTAEMPITIYFHTSNGSSDVLTTQVLETQAPWSGDGSITGNAGSQHVIAQDQSSSTDADGVTRSSSTTWSAHTT